MKQLLTVLLACTSLFAFSQVDEHFTDGNFNLNPAWSGDDSLFIINSTFQLQSKGTPGSSKDICLSVSNYLFDTTIWECFAKFNVSPSANNFCRYYLMSDSSNLKGSLEGYYVQFGGVTGNSDSITLYKQKGNNRFRIIGGRPSTVSKNTNQVRVQISRDPSGHWKMLSDTCGGINFILEGNGTDDEFTTSNFCGIFVRFTSSYSSNFYFDDIYSGPVIVDTIPPRVDSISILNDSAILVYFSKELDTTTVVPNRFGIDHGIGTPMQISFTGNSRKCVHLIFGNHLYNGTDYQLIIDSVNDISHQPISKIFKFNYFIPGKDDILISEIMPDPTPPIQLPQEEFVELYNRSNYSINLGGWSISDGTNTATIPSIILSPDSFLILCASTNASLFKPYGTTAGLTSFPSLNNSGDQIILRDASHNLIHSIMYDLSWYHDISKTEGGWSIEMNNPFTPCKMKYNFSASTDISGGTPGKVNSNWQKTHDTIPPSISNIIVADSTHLILVFNETMDSFSLLKSEIQISNNVIVIQKIIPGTDFDSLILVTNILPDITLLLNINSMKDCSGNNLSKNNYTIARASMLNQAESFDILIDEIMADPDPVVGLPPVEFIELYNRSSKMISLKNWSIEDAVSRGILPDIQISPDSFLIVCGTAGQTYFANLHSVSVIGFPSLDNSSEIIVLKNAKGQVIHAVNYSTAWYKDNFKQNGGYTLEMIDPKNPCGEINNWWASKDKTGGTPGRKNSVNGLNPDHSPPAIQKVYAINSNSVEITFNESLDSNSICLDSVHLSGFSIPSIIHRNPFLYSSFVVSFTDSFQTKNIYRISVNGIKDCVGNFSVNTINSSEGKFGLSETATPGDVVINEILFNPRSGGVDFVELYNRSDKLIDLINLRIANTNSDQSLNQVNDIAPKGYVIFPGDYCAVTSDPVILNREYLSPNSNGFISCTLPSYPDNNGTAVIADAAGNVFDKFSYDANMHSPLLSSVQGVSLERIDFNRPADDATNWNSAASGIDATPAYRNSQYASGNANGEHLRVDPELFSPDGDGYKDVTNIFYSFSQSSFIGNLFIYDAQGRMIKQLLHNSILGTEGACSWNGMNDENKKAPLGIYILLFEVFNLSGDVQYFKSVVAVGGK